MSIKRLLNKDLFYLILSIGLGIIVFNFFLSDGHFLFLDTSVPWSFEAWKLWLNDHFYAWNNMLGGGYPRTTYFSQATTFYFLDSIFSIFGNINFSFYCYYVLVFGLGTFFGYKFINLYVENKKISYFASLLIFINPFSIQWMGLYVFYIALLGLTLSLFSFVKYFRTNKILYLFLFAIGSLFLFTYQRFVFAFIFIFTFLLLFENIGKFKNIFSKENFLKYFKIIIVLIGVNSLWLAPILLNKFDGEKTFDGYENHLQYNEKFEKENIYNGLHHSSDFIKFININDTTYNYDLFFQKYHGENNLVLFFPFLIFLLSLLYFSFKKDKKYTFIFSYLLIIYFLLLSFRFLPIDYYSILVKILPALNVTHFYFQLAIIPIFTLLFAFILQDLGKKRFYIAILGIIYFSYLLFPITFGKDIYVNKDYKEFKLNDNCKNYNNYEVLILPFGLKSVGHISNNSILSYLVGYNNCYRIFNFNIYQNSTFDGKIKRDELFFDNFGGYYLENLEKNNIGEIILLNEELFNPSDKNYFYGEYEWAKKLLKKHSYKLVEKNKYFEKYKIFSENLSWEFIGNGKLSVFPVNYSKYLIKIDEVSKGSLIFKESYHKKWKFYKVNDDLCKNISTSKGLKIMENENYNNMFLNGFKDFYLFNQENLDKIKITNGYQTKIDISGLKGCYQYFFKPQLYLYVGMLITTLTISLLFLITIFQEIKNFKNRKNEK